MTTATIPNRMNLPSPLVRRIEKWRATYDKGESTVTVTTLLKPLQAAAIEMTREKELPQEDAAELIWAALGTAFHHFMHEDAEDEPDVIASEQRIYEDVRKWKLGGAFDLLTQEGDDVVLWDYKLSTVWNFLGGPKPDFEKQLNIYRYMLSHQRDYPTPTKLRICAIYRDFSKPRAKKDPDTYPQFQAGVHEVPVRDLVLVGNWVSERVAFLQKAVQASDHGDPLPPCSPADIWAKVAVVKPGKARALRVLDTVEEAQAWMDERTKPEEGCELEVREPARCSLYCRAASLCVQEAARKARNA